MKKENLFIKNLKILYKEGKSVAMIRRSAMMDLRFGDITEKEHEEFINWLEDQEEKLIELER